MRQSFLLISSCKDVVIYFNMPSVNFSEEKKLWKRGVGFVAGLDEAGRGPLAGPVVAAAVVLKRNTSPRGANGEALLFKTIKDSKQLSEKQREFFYEKLTTHPHITWAVGIVSEKVIDKINILEASKRAMLEALRAANIKADFLLIDGNFKINSKIPQRAIIKGDSKVFSICAAGIIAKVTRDRLMQKMHKKYPQYGFDKHKGYGTALHIKNIEKFGACRIHRKTFYPVSGFFAPSVQ